jgi:hypothetical protein
LRPPDQDNGESRQIARLIKKLEIDKEILAEQEELEEIARMIAKKEATN